MTTLAAPRRPGAISVAMIVASIGLSVAVSIAMDVILLSGPSAVPLEIVLAAALFNITVILLSGVGAVIEWRRPGHAIGRLLMLSGPLYAFLGISWLTAEVLEPLVEPRVYQLLFWASSFLSWPGVALIVGWIPLLFATGTLPGPRWRIPAFLLWFLFGISLVALAARSYPPVDGSEPVSSGELSSVVSLELLALVVLAAAAVVTRYRRGDGVERLQIRWFGTAVTLCLIGFAGTAVQSAVQPDGGPLLMTLVLYAGILAIPIAIGIAVTRYRLYEIDRIISRTIGYLIVTGILAVVFVGAILVFQAILAPILGENPVAVAASTLVVAALFQPLRVRVQRVVDRRFNRSRYDAERVVAAFSVRLRDDIDLENLAADIGAVVRQTVAPATIGVWLQEQESRG
jgi:hypothetical protein